MKRWMITLAIGGYLILSAGAAFASGDEHQGSKRSAHTNEYESKIYGTVRSIPAAMVGVWNVNGRDISVTKTTAIKEKHGKAEVGAYVEIEGTYSGSKLNAYEIEVKRGSQEVRKIRGAIQSIPDGTYGRWIVGDEEIAVSKDTFIREKHGKAEVGAYVEVEGVFSGKSLTARNIEVKRAKR
ncbi:MAG: DUF5666 domain-containing protein [Syntrophales bacterium]